MREKFNVVQKLAVDAASEKKAFDILILDLRNRSDLTDSFMICSANSKVQAQSIVDAILEKCHQPAPALSKQVHSNARLDIEESGREPVPRG